MKHFTAYRDIGDSFPPRPERYADLILQEDWFMHGKSKPVKEKVPGPINMIDLATTVANNWKSVDPSIKRYVVEVSSIVKKRRDQLRSSLSDDSVDEEEASTTTEDVSFNSSEDTPSITSLENKSKMHAKFAQPYPTQHRTATTQDNFPQFHNVSQDCSEMNVNSYGTTFQMMNQMMRAASNVTSMMGIDNAPAFSQPNNYIQGSHQHQTIPFSADRSMNQGHTGMFDNASLNYEVNNMHTANGGPTAPWSYQGIQSFSHEYLDQLAMRSSNSSCAFDAQTFMQPAMNGNNAALGFYPRTASLPDSTHDQALHCSQQRRFSHFQPSRNNTMMGFTQPFYISQEACYPRDFTAEPFDEMPAQAATRMEDVNNDTLFNDTFSSSMHSSYQPRKSLFRVAAEQVPEEPINVNVTIEDFAGVKAWAKQMFGEDLPSLQELNGQSNESTQAVDDASNKDETLGKEIKEVELTEEEIIHIYKSC